MKTKLLNFPTHASIADETYIDSTELFVDVNEVQIEHEGEIYILKINDQNLLELVSYTNKPH